MYAHNYSVYKVIKNFKTAYRINNYLLNRQRSLILRSVHDIGIADIPNVSLLEIKKTLKSHGYAVHDGYTSITTNCPICNCEKKQEASKVFINKTTGYFVCPKCNLYGEWSILERYLRKKGADKHTKDYIQELRQKNEEFCKEWNTLVASTVSVESLSEEEVEYLFKLFDLPLYKDSAKILKEVRVDSARTTLYFPLKNSADSVVGYNKLLAGSEPHYSSSGNHMAGLFSCKVQRCSREMRQCVLVPTMADVLALASHKVPGDLSWWHSGTLPPSLLPLWENQARVAVWGVGAARAVADKLGAERCCFVRTTEGPISASEAAAEGRNLRNMVSEARSAAHRSITTFASLRDDILAELNNIEKVRGVKWKRFPALVRLLGGHRRGELTVLTGPTGSGKTTFCAEYSLDLAQQGVSTLWGSFEIKNSRLARTMLQQYAGVQLEENLQRFNEFADGFQRLPIYFLTFHGPQSIKVVMEAVEHATYVHDIAHVVVDNVQFMLGTGDMGDRFFRQDAVVAAFRNFATRRDVHVTLVMHPRKEKDVEDLSTSSIFGSAKASQEADNVLIIQDKRLTAVRGKKFLQVAKNRYSGDLGIVPLDFDKESLSYAQKKKTRTKHEEAEEMKTSEVSDDGNLGMS